MIYTQRMLPKIKLPHLSNIRSCDGLICENDINNGLFFRIRTHEVYECRWIFCCIQSLWVRVEVRWLFEINLFPYTYGSCYYICSRSKVEDVEFENY